MGSWKDLEPNYLLAEEAPCKAMTMKRLRLICVVYVKYEEYLEVCKAQTSKYEARKCSLVRHE